VIMNSGKSITCLDCGLTSWNEKNVRNRYCPVCRKFHDDKETESLFPEFSTESPAQTDSFADCLFADWS
jgi:hypothetical protein